MCDEIACNFVAVHRVVEILFCAVQAFFTMMKKQLESYLHFCHAKGEAKNVVCMNLNRTVAFGCSQYFNSSRYF